MEHQHPFYTGNMRQAMLIFCNSKRKSCLKALASLWQHCAVYSWGLGIDLLTQWKKCQLLICIAWHSAGNVCMSGIHVLCRHKDKWHPFKLCDGKGLVSLCISHKFCWIVSDVAVRFSSNRQPPIVMVHVSARRWMDGSLGACGLFVTRVRGLPTLPLSNVMVVNPSLGCRPNAGKYILTYWQDVNLPSQSSTCRALQLLRPHVYFYSVFVF